LREKHRALRWVTSSREFNRGESLTVASRIAFTILLLATVALGLFGMDRSLWLDEAWVANSLRTPTLGAMFRYPGWLQTTPPLFLLLERVVVALGGISNAALRMIPLGLAAGGVAIFFACVRRMAALPIAALAAALAAFDPVVIEYSRTVKQYSGEFASSAALLAAAAVYFRTPKLSAFKWLMAALVVTMPLSYASVFLIPGIVLGVWSTGQHRRAAGLGAAAAMLLAILYVFCIRPNYSPLLREFWSVSSERVSPMVATVALLLSIAALVRFASSRQPALLVCALPPLLLAVSSKLGWYPESPRAWIFTMPCLGWLFAMLAEEFLARRPKVMNLAWALALAVPLLAAWRQIHQHRNLPTEDLDGAVQFLREHAKPSDLLLVHASVKEGFEWYAAADGFVNPAPRYGSSGWPCCVRDHLVAPRSSTRKAVIGDLESLIPAGFTGRIWLMYSSRPTQWDYVGLDEGNLWRSQVWAMGCPPEEFRAFANVAISPMYCRDPVGARRQSRSTDK